MWSKECRTEGLRGTCCDEDDLGSDVEGTLGVSGLAAGISRLTNKLRGFPKSSIHVSDSWCAVVCTCVLHICAVSTHVCVDLYTLHASRPVYALLHVQHSRLAWAIYAWFCVIHVLGNGHLTAHVRPTLPSSPVSGGSGRLRLGTISSVWLSPRNAWDTWQPVRALEGAGSQS